MIYYYILILLLFSISAACNSIMDTVDHHYATSVFSKIVSNKLWWNSDQGWKNKYIDRDPKKGRVKWFLNINKPVQLTDAWHFFKMLMIIFAAASIALACINPYAIFILDVHYSLNIIVHMLILGIVWNLTFSIFYNRILVIST